MPNRAFSHRNSTWTGMKKQQRKIYNSHSLNVLPFRGPFGTFGTPGTTPGVLPAGPDLL